MHSGSAFFQTAETKFQEGLLVVGEKQILVTVVQKMILGLVWNCPYWKVGVAHQNLCGYYSYFPKIPKK